MSHETAPHIPTGEVVELLQALIRNACVNDGTADSGHEHRSVATLADYFGEPGEVVAPHPGRESVIYRVPGAVPGAPRMVLLPHLDVVPADPSGWSRDPFAAEIADGYIWGRGAVDMLNVTAAMAAVFLRYLRGEVPPLPGELIFAAVADEEAGGKYGAAHLVEHHWDAVGGEYLLTEVANPSFRTAAGEVIPVTVAEKGPAWRHITCDGTPGHGSQPYGTDNALIPVARALTRLADTPMPVAISPQWARFVEGLDLPPDLAGDLVDPDRVDDAIERLAVDDPAFARWVHACTHLTVTPTVLRAGVKSNVVPHHAEADVDIRMVPGQDVDDVDDHLRKALGSELNDRLTIEPVMDFLPTATDPEDVLWEAIGDAAQATTGGRRLIPAITPVSTDARFYRARGTVAYGVGRFDDEATFGSMLSMFHGHDERVSIVSMERTTEFLAITLRRFGARLAGRHGAAPGPR